MRVHERGRRLSVRRHVLLATALMTAAATAGTLHRSWQQVNESSVSEFQKQHRVNLPPRPSQQQFLKVGPSIPVVVPILAAVPAQDSNISSVVAVAFAPWPVDQPAPCFDPRLETMPNKRWSDPRVQRSPTDSGLFFVKLLKTASSSTASLHLRAARNLARRQPPPQESTLALTSHKNYAICRSRHLHGRAGPGGHGYAHRNQTASFLWTILREPTARYVSEFFHFHVSREGLAPTTTNLVEFLRTGKHAKHHYLSWLSLERYRFGKTDPVQAANGILQAYNFIGITERSDESAVCFMMLLRLRLADILYLSSKSSGGYDDGQYKGRCTYIQPSNLTGEMREYLASDEWIGHVRGEQLLYQAANRSLDLTIDRIGKEAFQANLGRYRQAKRRVQSHCGPRTKFPCTETGQRRAGNETDCLWSDLGCGFDCLDEVSTELGLW